MSDDLLLFLLSGFKFWKIGSRKIFTISQDGKQRISHKRTIFSESDSDEDFEPVKKRRTASQRILSEIKDIRKNVESLLDISKKLKLPFGLHKQLQDAFKCHICCCSPIKLPVIFSRCCKQLLGCQLCVDQWYGGEEGVTRSCPLCRSERAYADTSVLKGLDDFLQSITPLINYNRSEDSDSDEFPSVSLQ